MSEKLFIRLIERIRHFIEEGGFAAFTVSLLIGFDALLLGLLLTPGGDSGLGAFADELRVWCFGVDPETGELEWSYVFSMLLPPLMLSAFLFLFWGKSIREIFSHPRSLAKHILPALILVACAGASFALLANDKKHEPDLPFPAEEIRTELPAPVFSLTNQRGEKVDLADMKDKVIVLTGIYTCCVQTCPAIMLQAKTAIDNLPPNLAKDLQFIAITMDPAYDTPEILGEFAKLHGMSGPLYHLVTGDVKKVEEALDAIGVGRERDKETDIISHTNQFVLVDKSGKVAYRLGLGERQMNWLTSAMTILLEEN